MNKEIGIDRKKLLDEMSNLPLRVLSTAYNYAVNYTKYGEDVTQKWLTAIAKTRALERAYDKGYYDGYHDALLRTNSKWIKTSDQPPDEYQRVLVTTDDGYVDTGDYSGNNSWFIGEGFFYESTEVLAWQPLPHPYKAGDDE